MILLTILLLAVIVTVFKLLGWLTKIWLKLLGFGIIAVIALTALALML